MEAQKKISNYNSYIQSAVFFSGGGARGAYQVGVLQGVFKVLSEKNHLFSLYSGYSAGAINAAYLAQHARSQRNAVDRLSKFWLDLHFADIYKSDPVSLTKNSLRWASDLSFGFLRGNKLAASLLDSEPLLHLLNSRLNPGWIDKQVRLGYLRGLSCHSYNYNLDKSIVFYQGHYDMKDWSHEKRESRRVQITPKHIYASCSIPLVFPAVTMNDHVYADGAVRNMSPLSASIHSGAKQILVIGVEKRGEPNPNFEPSVGAIISTMLKALFFDALDADLTRLEYMNRLIAEKSSFVKGSFQKVDTLLIKPSKEIREIAKTHFEEFPTAIRFLLEGLGSEDDVAELASYLLFHPSYIEKLIELGRDDALDRAEDIQKFFESL